MLLVLCILALMLIPMSSMAAMQSISDSEMAAVTGQAGVTIEVCAPSIALSLQSLTWGDPDGFTDNNCTPDVTTDDINYTTKGFINSSIPTGLISHIGISDLTIGIDVGTADVDTVDETTAVQITLSDGINITLDAFMVGIYLDRQCAVAQDYANACGMKTSDLAGGTPYTLALTGDLIPQYAEWTSTGDSNLSNPPVALNGKLLGVAGLSGLNVTLVGTTTLKISAH